MIEVNQWRAGRAMHGTTRFVDKLSLLVEKLPGSVDILVKTSNTPKSCPD
jgi:hypothetical protein